MCLPSRANFSGQTSNRFISFYVNTFSCKEVVRIAIDFTTSQVRQGSDVCSMYDIHIVNTCEEVGHIEIDFKNS